VRWAAFSPIANDAREFSLDLCGGAVANPESSLFYAAASSIGEDGKKLTKSQLAEKITFNVKFPVRVGCIADHFLLIKK